MNVLLFVSALLILMSLITYGRIQEYVGTLMVQGVLKEGMSELERCTYNKKMELLYRSTAAHAEDPPKETAENGTIKIPESDKNSESKAIAKINFRWMTEIQEQYPEIKTQIIKNLITQLYQKDVFYQEMLEKRPDVLNELLQQISYGVVKVGKISTPQDLIKLKFDDEELWEFFCVMLRITPSFKEEQKKLKEEKKPPSCTFVSLLNYLTAVRSDKIRVYLAPKPILMAIFENEEVVERLRKRRAEIFKEAKKQNAQQIVETGLKFQETFAGEAIKFLPLLDFTVSKTDPTNYRP